MRFAIAEAKAKSQLLIIPPLHALHSSLAGYFQGPHSHPLSDIAHFLLFSSESSPFFKAQLKVLFLQEVLLDSLPLLSAPCRLLLAGSLLRALKLSSFSLICLFFLNLNLFIFSFASDYIFPFTSLKWNHGIFKS